MKRKLFSMVVMLGLLGFVLPGSPTIIGISWALDTAPPNNPPIVASTIPQFIDPLPILDVTGLSNGTIQTILAGTNQIPLVMKEFKARMLPTGFKPGGGYDGTWVWGYVKAGTDTSVTRDTYTGPVVAATRNIPTEIKYINNLPTGDSTNVDAYKYAIDQSLHWANPNMVNRYIPGPNAVIVPWLGNPDHYLGPIPAAVHLHGAEDPAAIDGGPESWFLSDGSKVGKAFYSKGWDGVTPQNYVIYRYPNVQEASPLWFHDHTLGATRLNVYMGLAGAYALIDPKLKLPAGLNALGLRGGPLGPTPADDTLIPMVIQDRMFDEKGQLYFPAGPEDPANPSPNPEHAYWVPEFFGEEPNVSDTICVNGKTWPYLNVKAQRYRFYLINGSNARSYILTFEDTSKTTNPAHPVIWQIATDQGYLDKPVGLDNLVIMPGERAGFIIDFGGLNPGTTLILNNLGPDSPFGGGTPGADFDSSDPATTGKVMQFRVVAGAASPDSSFNPAAPGATIRKSGQTIVRLVDPLTGTLAKKVNPDLTRALTLVEIANDNERTVNGATYSGGPLEVLVNNTKWMGERPNEANPNQMTGLDPVNGGVADGIGNYLTELPKEGATEVWEIVNTTADAHPIHTHLAQFQLLNRQAYDLAGYVAAYQAAFPGGSFIPAYGPPKPYDPASNELSGGKYGGNPDVTPFLVDPNTSQSFPIIPPHPNEAGWKDTILTPPGYVTRFVVRWAPTDIPVLPNGSAVMRYDFIPNDEIPGNPGAIFDYVWHCHIVDHEDNEMMRPDAVGANPLIPKAARPYQMGRDY
jgi:FtsP/CotA-like multicopper oxidase with cupredoxin domain